MGAVRESLHPYELALLRGGSAQLTDAVLVELVLRGWLTAHKGNYGKPGPESDRPRVEPMRQLADMLPVEQAIFTIVGRYGASYHQFVYAARDAPAVEAMRRELEARGLAVRGAERRLDRLGDIGLLGLLVWVIAVLVLVQVVGDDAISSNLALVALPVLVWIVLLGVAAFAIRLTTKAGRRAVREAKTIPNWADLLSETYWVAASGLRSLDDRKLYKQITGSSWNTDSGE